MTGLYAAIHFLVDGICAWAMLGRLGGDYGGLLVYNFCAFALQLPLGAVLDRLGGRKMPLCFAAVGCALTILGALSHPAVLGLGNALFHVGGGVDVIRDGGKCEKLGIFVAPGALGLSLGGLLAGKSFWLLLPAAVMMALFLCFVRSPGEISTAPGSRPSNAGRRSEPQRYRPPSCPAPPRRPRRGPAIRPSRGTPPGIPRSSAEPPR